MMGVVKRRRTVEHLDPQSERHRADQRKAKAARLELAQNVVVSVAPAETLKYASLAGGVRLDNEGRELSAEAFQAKVEEAQRRSFYWASYSKRNGALSLRKCPTDPVHQAAFSYFPAYDLTFSRLEERRLAVAPFVKEHSHILINEFAAATGYEVIAAAVHPEEGVHHHHVLWSCVDKDHRLLHQASGRGRRGLRFLGPALTGTLRLVDKGFWPEEDAVLARKFLADRVRGGQEPIDWTLSQVLDGLAEKTLQYLSNCFPWVKKVWDEAESDYRATVLARRAARPDLMAERLTFLDEENANLRAELERSREVSNNTLAPPLRSIRGLGGSRRIGL